MDDGYCCGSLRAACSPGTDNEAYAAAMWFDKGHWTVGEVGEPMKWCPWCGADLAGYEPSRLRVLFRSSGSVKAIEIETVEPIGASAAEVEPGTMDVWGLLADEIAAQIRDLIMRAVERRGKEVERERERIGTYEPRPRRG